MKCIIKAIITLSSSALTVLAYSSSYYYQCPNYNAVTVSNNVYRANIIASTGVSVFAKGQSTDPGPTTGPSLSNNVVADTQGVLYCSYSTALSSIPGIQISTYGTYPPVLNVTQCTLNGKSFQRSTARCTGSEISCRIQCST